MFRLQASIETFPVAGRFVISRGARTDIRVVSVRIERDGAIGRSEAVPYARYGETPEQVAEDILQMQEPLRDGLDRAGLIERMPAGAARNAIDCALWDMESRIRGCTAFDIAGIAAPEPRITAYTISLGSAGDMHRAAGANAGRPLLKVKLGAEGDVERIRAVRMAARATRLIVDANEGWRPENLAANIAACVEAGVELIEQPLPAGSDQALARRSADILVCADESVHTSADLPRLAGLYDAVNIKLDKSGGLTEAMRMVAAARSQGFLVMVGCMLGTSLAMAPATVLAQDADYVDLDGPLLLASDRAHPLAYSEGRVGLPLPGLWGS